MLIWPRSPRNRRRESLAVKSPIRKSIAGKFTVNVCFLRCIYQHTIDCVGSFVCMDDRFLEGGANRDCPGKVLVCGLDTPKSQNIYLADPSALTGRDVYLSAPGNVLVLSYYPPYIHNSHPSVKTFELLSESILPGPQNIIGTPTRCVWCTPVPSSSRLSIPSPCLTLSPHPSDLIYSRNGYGLREIIQGQLPI